MIKSVVLCRASVWRGRLDSLVSLTEQYKAYPAREELLEMCPKGQQRGLRQID